MTTSGVGFPHAPGSGEPPPRLVSCAMIIMYIRAWSRSFRAWTEEVRRELLGTYVLRTATMVDSLFRQAQGLAPSLSYDERPFLAKC